MILTRARKRVFSDKCEPSKLDPKATSHRSLVVLRSRWFAVVDFGVYVYVCKLNEYTGWIESLQGIGGIYEPFRLIYEPHLGPGVEFFFTLGRPEITLAGAVCFASGKLLCIMCVLSIAVAVGSSLENRWGG